MVLRGGDQWVSAMCTWRRWGSARVTTFWPVLRGHTIKQAEGSWWSWNFEKLVLLISKVGAAVRLWFFVLEVSWADAF
jgi:hypothetical protein